MLGMMDHGSEPCEDFPAFVCGGATGNHQNRLLTKQFTQLENYLTKTSEEKHGDLKSFSNFYQSCLDYDMDFNFVERMQFGK